MQPLVEHIFRYPVKGLSGQALAAVELVDGRGMPLDRRWGLLSGSAADGQARSAWRPKSDFLTLLRHERLAALEAEFDSESVFLVVKRGGRAVARGRLDQPTGRMLLEQFFAAYLAGAAPGLPHLVEAADGAFTDLNAPYISLLNLASVRDLEARVAKRAVDPRRFRANLWLDGVPAWAERNWIGRTLAVGAIRLRVEAPIGRCGATGVDPATGERDLNLVQILQRGYGHGECGVYARVLTGGAIAVGDAVAVLDDPVPE